MNWSDLVNAGFEFSAVFFLSLNCIQVYKDKMVRGMSVLAVTFFSVWGYWNIFFYSHNNLTWSSIAGGLVAVVNTFYVFQLVYYTNHPGGKLTQENSDG